MAHMSRPDPIVQKRSNKVYLPSGEELEEARQQSHSVVSKNYYKGDYRIICGLLIAFSVIVYVGVTGLVLPWLADPNFYYPLPQVLATPLLALVVFLAIMTLWSYAVAVNQHPGRPVRGWTPSRHLDGVDPALDPFSPNRKVRLCDICETLKPPRTHHCKVCNTCVLRGDHHCMWTGNCVGYLNHKAFFLFLWYLCTLIWLGIVFGSLRIASVIIFGAGYASLYEDFAANWPPLFMVVSCIAAQMYAGVLFQEQFQQIVANVTTIEKRDLVAWKGCWRENTRKTGESQRLVWPYNMGGVTGNVEALIHDGWWLAWVPSVPHYDEDAGTYFPMNSDYIDAIREESGEKASGSGGEGSSLGSNGNTQKQA